MGRPSTASKDDLLVKTVERARGAAHAADELLSQLDTTKEPVLADLVDGILRDWTQSGAADLFADDSQFARFYRATIISLFVQYASCMHKTLKSMHARLDAPDLNAAQYLAMAERFTSSMQMLQQEVQAVHGPAVEPDSEDELDRRLREARARLGLPPPGIACAEVIPGDEEEGNADRSDPE